MPDAKITALTANTAPLVTDLLPMVDDPSGSPTTQKITFSDALKVINGLTEDTAPDASADFLVTYDTSASGVKKVKPSNLTSGDCYNYLINGGFHFAQRQAPSTLTTITDKAWGADRWQQFAENASWQYQRNDATGESGLTSQYYGLFKKITSTGKGIFVQKIEGNSSIALRSKTVVFQIKMKASASKTIRMGVLELQTGGTVDTFPAALASAFGANTVDPTWGTNVAIVTAAQSKSVTTSWQSFSVSVTIPATSKNVVCAIWTDSQFAANDTLSVAEAGLFVSGSVQAWKPRVLQQELALAQRYYQKSYSLDVVPGTVSYTGAPYSYQNSTFPTLTIYFPTWSRTAAPTVTTYGPVAGASGKMKIDASDVNATVVSSGQNHFSVYPTSAVSSALHDAQVHFTVNDEIA